MRRLAVWGLLCVTSWCTAQNVPPLPEIPSPLGAMPSVDELPVRNELPPILVNDDGSPVTKENWPQRREQMLRTLEYYYAGSAPPPPGNVRGEVLRDEKVADGKAHYRLIKLTFGPDNQLSLHIGCFTPTGAHGVPAVVMIGGGVPGAPKLPRLPNGPTQGSSRDALSVVGPSTRPGRPPFAWPGEGLSADEIASKNLAVQHGFAYIVFDFNECGEDTTLRNADGSWAYRTTRFPAAYPKYDWGLLRVWAWGASRIVDYLQTDPAIDPHKIIITGLSRAGKATLVAGAFDERFAIVAPASSAGGGTQAFRFSGAEHGGAEGLTEMATKYPNWFSPRLRSFRGHAEKLPFDQHWLIAACAPRPFLDRQGTQDFIINHNGVKQSYLAAKQVYDLLGAGDVIGVNWTDRPHAYRDGDWIALLAMADHAFDGKPYTLPLDQFPTSQPTKP